MILRYLAVAAATLCLALPLAAAHAETTSETAIPTVVLVDGDLTTLRYLPLYLDVAHTPAPNVMTAPQMGYAGAAGGAIGGLVAGALINYEAKILAQQQADTTLLSLVEPLGEDGMQPLLRRAFEDALAEHGMDPLAVAFSGHRTPETKTFERMPAARKARRFLMVRNGAVADGTVKLPLALHDTKRQLRLAIRLEMLEGKLQRHRLVLNRDVAVYSDLLPLAEGEEPLDVLGADEQARFRQTLGRAVSDAMALALSDRSFPKVGKGDVIGALSELGLTEFEGVLIEEKAGRALVWTRDDTLVSIPAAQLLTGDALVAARVQESTRREVPVTAVEITGPAAAAEEADAPAEDDAAEDDSTETSD